MTGLTSHDWFLWSLALLIVFPVLVILLGEAKLRLARAGMSAYASPLAWLQNGCLPLLFLVLLLRNVVGLDSNSLSVRIADTAFWIVFINFVLALTNVAFFGDSESSGLHTRVPKLLLDLLRVFLVLVATAVVVSSVWGVDLGSLLTALGVGSLVIGLALQDTLGSVFSGIAMISTRQLRVGDWVIIGGEEGVLTNLNWRSVTLRSGMGDDVIMPNSSVARDKLTIIGAGTNRRLFGAEVKIAYDHPPGEVLALLEETARATKGVSKEAPPAARLAEFGDYAISYRVWITVDELVQMPFVRHEFLCNFWYAANRKGLVFPAQHHHDYQLPPDMRMQHRPSPLELAQTVAASGAVPRPPEVLTVLMQHAAQRTYRATETLIKQGEMLRDVLVVVAGSAQACYAPGDGSDTSIHTFERGQLVLFKSLFRGGDAPFSVRAASELVVVTIPGSDFKQFLANDIALAHEIELALSTREDAAAAVLAKSFPGQFEANGSADRVHYLRDMFRV